MSVGREELAEDQFPYVMRDFLTGEIIQVTQSQREFVRDSSGNLVHGTSFSTPRFDKAVEERKTIEVVNGDERKYYQVVKPPNQALGKTPFSIFVRSVEKPANLAELASQNLVSSPGQIK